MYINKLFASNKTSCQSRADQSGVVAELSGHDPAAAFIEAFFRRALTEGRAKEFAALPQTAADGDDFRIQQIDQR